MKGLLRIVLVIVVLGGGAAWWFLSAPEAATRPQTVAVERGSVEETVLASGVLQANRVVSVGAEVSGRIETLAVAVGDVVTAGDVIAAIDSLDQQNAVRAAEASLANVSAQRRAQEATSVQAQQALDRATQMRDQSLISEADFQIAAAAVATAEAQIDGLDAQIDQAELQVDSARLDLSRTQITAPISGTVVAVLVGEGATVSAAQSSPTIVKIADLDTMVIRAEISEADVTRVTAGQRVYFTILGEPDNRIEAELRTVEPAPAAIAEDDSGLGSGDSAIYYNGLFEVPNPDGRLRIAMTAQVTIVLEAVPDGLVVPASVLTRPLDSGLYAVMVYDPDTDTTEERTIEIGLSNNIDAVVLAGLDEGEQVVDPTGRLVSAGAGGGGGGRPPGFGGVRMPGMGG